MTTVLKARVNWMHNFGNAPHLEVLVDRLPEWSELTWSRHEHPAGNGFYYYTELDGYVQFLATRKVWRNDGWLEMARDVPDEGFSGAGFSLAMADGSMIHLNGPWSGSSICVNGLGLGPVMEVSITDDPVSFERGWTFSAGAITVELARKAAELAGCKLVQFAFAGGRSIFYPARVDYPDDVVEMDEGDFFAHYRTIDLKPEVSNG